ncbi:hypothetical protein ACIPYQ_11510 [Streptomyces sp. NPDC090045]|uniref:hypothetical protein n=1 Tax=Streptomyces sp. NPDC090045 TaxID=3365927 RepID=UPI0038059090
MNSPKLDKVADVLLNLNPCRTLLYLRESPTAHRLVTDLAAGTCELTDEALDARMTSQKDMAVDYFRTVRDSAGVLPVRDEYMVRLDDDRVHDRGHRRSRRPPPGHRLRPLGPDRTHPEASPRQSDLRLTSDIAQAQIAKAVAAPVDLCLTSENHQNPYDARPFVRWAVRGKFASEISIPARPRQIFHRPLDAYERWATARRLLNDDSIETRDRVAGLAVLLQGQYPARACRLTTAHVTHDENGVTLRLNRTPLRLPPLDGLVLQFVDIANDHQHTVMSNDLNAPWLFPTQRPGKPPGSNQLSRRLRKIGLPTEAGRCAAQLDLCSQMPSAVLQCLLGISHAAAERWAAGAVRTLPRIQNQRVPAIPVIHGERLPRGVTDEPGRERLGHRGLLGGLPSCSDGPRHSVLPCPGRRGRRCHAPAGTWYGL